MSDTSIQAVTSTPLETKRQEPPVVKVATVTVKGYMRTILAKLHVHNRREAVVTARKFGLIP